MARSIACRMAPHKRQISGKEKLSVTVVKLSEDSSQHSHRPQAHTAARHAAEQNQKCRMGEMAQTVVWLVSVWQKKKL